jgi:sterol 3beta-glucosyltransferase
LKAFVDREDPPVYIGFGSMTMANPDAMLRTVVSAVEQVGCRAVISAGWGDLKPQTLSKNICAAEDVPHAWLFPKMASIVHHGGAGTTAATLRAGRPSVVVPFFSDQPFWGHRLERLGVSAATIHRRELTSDRLAAAIEVTLGSHSLRETSAQLGAKIRAEDGVHRAAERIEQCVKAPQARPRPRSISVRPARVQA